MPKKYEQSRINEVREFIRKHNEEHNGRGGVSAANQKYGVSMVTLRKWLGRPGRKPGRPAMHKTMPTGNTLVERAERAKNYAEELRDKLSEVESDNKRIEELKKLLSDERQAVETAFSELLP